MKSISYNTLETIEWPEEIFIDGGLLSRGDTMLIGAESKGGKSTFIAGMIRQLITGGNFIGFKVIKPLRILYMQAELRESRLKQRLLPTYSGLTQAQKLNLYIWSTNGLVLFNPNHRESIEMEIISTSPDILIIDPMLNFHDYNENNSQEMATFFRHLDYIKNQYNLAIIMAHHFRKATADNSKIKMSLLESMRGSSALRGWAVTTIAMEGRGASEYRELQFDLRNSDEPITRIVHYNHTTKDFDWHDPMSTISQWAIEFLESRNGEPVSSEQFITKMLADNEVLGGNRTKAFAIKNVLSNTKVIRTSNQGKLKIISRF